MFHVGISEGAAVTLDHPSVQLSGHISKGLPVGIQDARIVLA